MGRSFIRKTTSFIKMLFLIGQIKSMKKLGHSFDRRGFFERVAFKEDGLEVKLYARKFLDEVVIVAVSKGGKVNDRPVMTVRLHDLIYGLPIDLRTCGDIDAVVKKSSFKSFTSIVKNIETNYLTELTEIPAYKLFPWMSGIVRDEILNGEDKELKVDYLRY